MGMVERLLQNVPLPKVIPVKQTFSTYEVENVIETLRKGIQSLPGIKKKIRPGMRVAIAVGSRGIAELSLLVRTVAEELKLMGAQPFIVPAMGSHGGASAIGQKELLASLGVTEENVGCPVESSMEVVQVGTTSQALPVYIDKNAFYADGIVIINRVKVHTAFSGPNESGMAKMIAIGLGKQKGASACHARGFKDMAASIAEIAQIAMQHAPFLFGIGTLENAYEKIAKIAVVPPEKIIVTDQALLREMKLNTSRILLQPIDVLIVDRLGKEFSGGGMDPYITGRAPTPYVTVPGSQVARLVVLDVSEASHGNANGVGMADITTRRLVDKIDFDAMYTNILTSTVTPSGRIPLVMESDRLAVQAAIKTCNARDLAEVRLVRISNTLHIDRIYISEALLPEAKAHGNIVVCGSPQELSFDMQGNLTDL